MRSLFRLKDKNNYPSFKTYTGLYYLVYGEEPIDDDELVLQNVWTTKGVRAYF